MKKAILVLLLGSLFLAQNSHAMECDDNLRALVAMVEELNLKCKAGDKDACDAYDALDPEVKKFVCSE